MMIGAIDTYAPLWWQVKEALGDAQLAASRTATREDPGSRALWWHIALLHLDHAHEVRKEHIGRPLTTGRRRAES